MTPELHKQGMWIITPCFIIPRVYIMTVIFISGGYRNTRRKPPPVSKGQAQ
jgi:hypothetical protein